MKKPLTLAILIRELVRIKDNHIDLVDLTNQRIDWSFSRWEKSYFKNFLFR